MYCLSINNMIIFTCMCRFLCLLSDFTEESSVQYREENTHSKIKAGRKSPGSLKEHSPRGCFHLMLWPFNQTHVFSFSFVVSVINKNLISVLSLSVYLT